MNSGTVLDLGTDLVRQDTAPITAKTAPDTLITQNAEFSRQLQRLSIYAKPDATVLITGETGTGKELVARALHKLSARAAKVFVPVNCGAMPADLIENEFFGHESQAFTGASSRHLGLVSEADGGTLFLDEIDSAPLPFQAKLLRLLQHQEFRLVGSTKLCHANVRVIAAANSDLESAIADGKFRRDLYYRLDVLRLDLPPLRKRREDIPLLAQHFLEKYSRLFNKRIAGLSRSAFDLLSSYGWPGNIRELENIIQRAVVLCQQDELTPAHIELPARAGASDQSFRAQKAAVIDEFERTYLIRLLTEHNGNITKAALAAGKNRRAFFQLMKKHRIRIVRGVPHFQQEGAEKRRE
jgi:two-component system response regulator GlrR